VKNVKEEVSLIIFPGDGSSWWYEYLVAFIIANLWGKGQQNS
jgi:hypothetical protein